MNLNSLKQLESELRVMDISDLKPNYSALGRKYNLDYRTVKKYHEGYSGKPKKRNKPSKLDTHLNTIQTKLAIPRTTLKGVYEFLVDTYSRDEIGSYSNFKVYCKKHKLKPVKRNGSTSSGGSTLYEVNPAELAQCDWKESIEMTSIHGEAFTVNVFHLVLKFSRYSYLELTLSRERSIVQRCLINSFTFYGGVPKRILFDNMSSVIDTSVKPKRVNSQMVQFSKDFNFQIQACKARHPYTKGTNEARNKMIDWLRPYNNEFETIEDLQEIIEKINLKMNLEVCQGTDLPPSVLFLNEKEYLSPMPCSTVIDGYLTPTKVKVTPQQLVLHKGIKYSVDKQYINEYVLTEEFNDILQIYYKGKLIQIHHLSNNPINYTKSHYEQSLEGLIPGEKMNERISNNLSIMDNLLTAREVVVTKEDACKSHEAMLAYLISKGYQSNWIRRFLQTLSSNQRKIFFSELSKLLPYVYDEEQLFYAFKHAATKESVKYIRLNLWELDHQGNYYFLTEDGYRSVEKDFKDEVEKILFTRWE